MLIRLLRSHLLPYRRAVSVLVVLQLVATLAMLYLPTLNADIIDDGVVKGTRATSSGSAASCSP